MVSVYVLPVDVCLVHDIGYTELMVFYLAHFKFIFKDLRLKKGMQYTSCTSKEIHLTHDLYLT